MKYFGTILILWTLLMIPRSIATIVNSVAIDRPEESSVPSEAFQRGRLVGSILSPILFTSLGIFLIKKDINNKKKLLNTQHYLGKTSKKYNCTFCSYKYDPEIGDPDRGIEQGTAFENIPEDWFCPICEASKKDFNATDHD